MYHNCDHVRFLISLLLQRRSWVLVEFLSWVLTGLDMLFCAWLDFSAQWLLEIHVYSLIFYFRALVYSYGIINFWLHSQVYTFSCVHFSAASYLMSLLTWITFLWILFHLQNVRMCVMDHKTGFVNTIKLIWFWALFGLCGRVDKQFMSVIVSVYNCSDYAWWFCELCKLPF